MNVLTPRLDILPGSQRALWPELVAVPSHFILYGGTALALRLGHRVSVDFDFFSHPPLDHGALRAGVPFLRSAAVLQEEADTLTVTVDRNGPIKVSFFGSITFGRVGNPQPTEDGVLRVASLLDLAGTKLKVLLQRVELKDYADVAALLRSGMKLGDMLGAGRALFGTAFNPIMAQKTLSYFEGADFSGLDQATRNLLAQEAARDVLVSEIPLLSTRLN